METGNNQASNTPKIIAAIIGVLIICSCVAIAGAGLLAYQAFRLLPPEIGTQIFPTEEFSTAMPAPTLERPSTDSISTETLETLEQTEIPENDPIDLACRLQEVCNVPTTVPGKAYQVGDKEKFWVSNSDTAEHRQIDATLLYITPHSYFWAEDGIDVNSNDVKALMDTFESEIYPTNREFFGSELTPGVDGDPHIFVIYARGLGRSTAGYFNTTDSYHPSVNEYSNARETFMVSEIVNLADSETYSVLAHEFVHMIQFATDQNDETWMTEGFAEVGSFVNGYYPDIFAWEYAAAPDLQLTDWRADGNNRLHYGQSFLYLTYFLDRFGEEATKALNTNPENGLVSVDDTLAQLNITDPQTGELITAEDVFMDWAAALYLNDESVGDGRYAYHNYPGVPQTTDTEVIEKCPQAALPRQVSQHGIDYIKIGCQGDFTLHFSGSTIAKLFPTDIHSGSYAFWSNKGDESNMTLTREFDFTNVSGPVEMSYWTWYLIEEDWDYLHVEASTDGETWEILTTPSGTDEDPSGNSYGWGYTGSTGDWIQERVDLSQFAGQTVQIRFEYVTDAAVHEDGFLLDDVQIEAINYQEDFEAGDGGWEAEGFVRVENELPQTYRLALITRGDTTTVTPIPVSADQTAEIPLSLNAGEEAILIVTGTTRFTRQLAAYQIEIR
ncbi:MAG TPA: choice-of-anchor J domain-containing protein [Anaerolineales bacterium]|nr:choice-of-anchor J domain-containing protein [Anaerolineales bacterium]